MASDTATAVKPKLSAKVEILEAEASDPSNDIPHEEAKRRFAQWFAK